MPDTHSLESAPSPSEDRGSELGATFADPIEHLLFVIGGDAQGSPYHEALDELGPTTLIEFLELSDDDFTRSRHLTVAQAKNLIAVRGWARNRACYDVDDFVTRLSAESLLNYRTYRFSLGQSPTVDAPIPTTQTAAAVATPVDATPVYVPSDIPALDAFQKGVKRDITAFPKFHDRRLFNTWNRNFQATATAQGLELALDPDYVPITDDEVAVFDQIKKFVHAVLTSCVKETTSISIVRTYSIVGTPQKGDGQKLYAELCRKFGSGIAAYNARTTLELDLMGMRLDKDYNKPICNFLSPFHHRVQDLWDARDPTDTHSYGDVWCREQLRHALEPNHKMVSHFNSLVTLESHTLRSGGMPHTYVEFYKLLVEHAEILDKSFKPRQNQQANSTDTDRGNRNGGRGTPGGRGRGSGRSSGHGSGRGRGRVNGGRSHDPNRDPSDPHTDPTNPNVWLNNANYYALSPKLQQRRVVTYAM
eukprot:scaffold914_cov218-Amphora_coffeaeformis.AAC.1